MNPQPPADLGAEFNFAAHLIAGNQSRTDKTAYIDDASSLTFGELAERVQRMAAALLKAGVRREERILILMHDCNDWPVAFLGALYAGIVPVAVNTLLTAEDYAYMLKNSRATAAMVSEALLETFETALEDSKLSLNTLVVSASGNTNHLSAQSFDEFLSTAEPLQQTR